MTFQLQAYKATAIPYAGANRNRYLQYVDLAITGAATDTTLDIASDTAGSLGTFWTAVTTNATYKNTGLAALATIQNIVSVCKDLKSVQSEQLLSRTAVGAGNVQSILSAASVGGAASEVYVVTGLLSTDTILAVTPVVAPANTIPTILNILSGTISTGTTVTATVTGLLSTDTILAVTQSVANANGVVPVAYSFNATNTLNLTYEATSGANGKVNVLISRAGVQGVAMIGYNTLAANALTVQYQGDPGAGAKVLVEFYRPTGTITPGAGTYDLSITGHLPTITFGTNDAPTTNYLRLAWLLQDDVMGINADYGTAF